MQVSFQQGIIRYPFTVTGSQQTFLVKSSSTTVDLQTSGGVVDVTFAYKDTNYLLTEATTVPSAWIGLPVATDAWLYWDIDLKTAVRTFNFTLLQPVVNPSAPVSPVTDQHWFNTVSKIMYVWTGVNWKETVRVFAAKVNGTQFQGLGAGVIGFPFAGTQVGLNVTSFTGRIIFDGNGVPIRRQNGAFFTTEDDFFINGSPINTIRLEANVITATAQEVIPQFYVVKLSDFNEILLANYNDLNTTFIAVAMQNGGLGDVVTLISQGTITNNSWNWPNPGAPLWVLTGGALTDVDPNISDPITYPISKAPIARVIAPTTIFFNQGLGDAQNNSAVAILPATTTHLGTVKLSHSSLDPGNPVVVETTDPRNSDARTPLPHSQGADTIITPTFGTITGATLDVQLPQIFAQVLHLDGGGTLTGGTLVFGAGSSIDMGSHPLTNVPTPGAGGDAANKIYVDSRSLDDLTDVQLTAPTSSQVLSFNGAQWVNTNFPFIPLSFLDLNDTPNSYTGQANLFVAVNPGATGLTFVPGGGGGGAQPLNQIVYGTGPSESSDPTLIYNVVNGQYTLAPTPKNTPGDVTIASANSQAFIAPATSGFMELLFQNAGTQAFLEIAFTDWNTGNEPTGLANDATVYSVTITVDGVPTIVSDVGSNLQTYNDIFNVFFFAVPALNPGFVPFTPPLVTIVIYSPTLGSASTISFTEAGPGLGLFTALSGTLTGFSVTPHSPGVDGQIVFSPSDPTGITGTHSDDVVVDGIIHNVTVSNITAPTIGTLTSQLATQLSSFATVVFNGTETIIVTSLTTGVTSTVSTPQNDLLQTPGPITYLVNTGFTPGVNAIPTQNPSGIVSLQSNNSIREHSANIYELSGAAGTNLLLADGVEISIHPDLFDVSCGTGVFEIMAIAQDELNAPPAIATALTIRGGFANGAISSVKETYIGGSATIDVSLAGGNAHLLRVAATTSVGVVWRARVTVLSMLGGCTIPV